MYATKRNFKVLVIDESSVSRKLVELALSQKQCSLVFATTGQEAMKLFEEHKPALVIMDWMMPDLTGEEICQRMRSRSGDSYAYIIVLTGRTDKTSLVKALDAGADDYLTKPFRRAELIARVGVGMRIIGLHRQIETKNVLLEQLALTDALTGLPNRRAIENWAATQLSSAARHGFSVWVVQADLDHFKQVNDTFGHDAGDAVLKKFARILKAHLRRSDLCGRLGGEEFLMVMTHATRENALAAMERIRAELEMTPLTFRGCTVAVTASFGIAGFEGNQSPTGFGNLQRLADAALYTAKRGGRNRIEIAMAEAS